MKLCLNITVCKELHIAWNEELQGRWFSMLLPATMLSYARYTIHLEHKHWSLKDNHFLFPKAVNSISMWMIWPWRCTYEMIKYAGYQCDLWILALIIYLIIWCHADKSLSINMVITIASSTSGLLLSVVILIAIIFVHQSRKKMLHEFMKSKYPTVRHISVVFFFKFDFAWTIFNLDNSIYENFGWPHVHYNIRL